jgi:hypothetical protein
MELIMINKNIDFGVQYDVIDEIKQPEGMKSRLIQSHRTKSIAIQTWGSMSGEWITTQRYKDVQEMWDKSKAIAASIIADKKKKKKAK